MPSVKLAKFLYLKQGDFRNIVSERRIIVNPAESLGNHIKGFDLDRNDWRTFRRENIVGGVSLSTRYLDTVSGEVRERP